MAEKKSKKRIINKKSERIVNLEDRYFVVYLGPGVYERHGLRLEQGIVNEVSLDDFKWVKDQWLVHPVYLNRVTI
jgi:hypothetical protein